MILFNSILSVIWIWPTDQKYAKNSPIPGWKFQLETSNQKYLNRDFLFLPLLLSHTVWVIQLNLAFWSLINTSNTFQCMSFPDNNINKMRLSNKPFLPNSTWVSKESTTILATHSILLNMKGQQLFISKKRCVGWAHFVTGKNIGILLKVEHLYSNGL